MKGIEQTTFIIIAVVAILGLGIAIQQGIIELPIGVPGQLSGFTTLSVSNAQFQSSGDFFNGARYILTVAQGGLGQFATGHITPSDLSGSGETPDEAFDIKITYGKQSCEYEINPNRDAVPIFSYNLKEYPINIFLDCTEEDALKAVGGQNLFSHGKPAFSFSCFAVQRNPIISVIAVNSISNPEVHTIATVETSGGINNALNGQFNIDTRGSTQGFVGSNAYVTWNGYLARSVCATNQDEFTGLYESGKWKIGSKFLYDSYVSTKITNEVLLTNPSGITKENLQTAINRINSASVTARNERSFGEFISNPFSVNNAVINQALDSFVSVPVYTFIIKADALGISQPIANIKPVSCEWPTFSTNGNIKVNLINDGESGNADVSASCADLTSGTTKTVSVTGGGTSSVFIPVSGSTLQPKTVSCSINVNNAAGSTNSISCSTTLLNEITCEANQKFCDGNAVKQCNSFGSGSSIIDTCESTEICSLDASGVSACIGTDGCPNSGTINPTACNQCAQGFELVGAIPFISDTGVCEEIEDELPIAIIVGGIGAALIFLISGRNSLRERDVVGIAISSIFAVIVFFVLFWVVENIETIALTLGLTAILGGAALFFLAPVLITIFGVIAVIVSKFR